ncbi:MAG: NAD(P)H-dependent oxidoreductase [Flavobacteriales bacterium]|nr:NAD(P)H-dependent oxidoreductase [Flavobacteriales bacterium]
MNFIENQNWRYATKKFDASKIVASKDIDFLKEAVRLAATSYGLQPFQVLIIETQEIKEQLKSASWGQSQITDASHVFVFANKTEISDEFVDDYIKNTSETRDIAIENLKQYGGFVKKTIAKMDSETLSNWTSKQTYIALGNLLNAAAEIKVDTTPIEGFDSKQYNEILGLTQKDLNATVVAAVGYRSEEDNTQHLGKIRRTTEELFITL